MQKLWLVRHGQTSWNLSRKIQGWTDIPLNETGREQAFRLQMYFSGIPFHTIFSSDLQRAYETARILAADEHREIEVNSDLRERCFGTSEGTVRTDFSETFIDSLPDAESTVSVMTRGARFLDILTKNYPSGRYLCVTHGGMIRGLLMHLGASHIPTLSNTSVTVLEHHAEKWNVVCINWRKHVEEEKGFNHEVEALIQDELKIYR